MWRRLFFALVGCMLVIGPGGVSVAADFYELRDGIANSQYFWRQNTVGNQYLFFVGNSVLAGAGLQSPDLRYSLRMTEAIRKHFPEATIVETRHTQPGGSWFGQYRVSRGQPVFGEVIASGHLAILDFAADDRGADLDRVKASLEGLVRQIVRYRDTHSQILVYTLTPEMLADYRSGRTPAYIAACEEIAAHYGIPSLNLARYAADRIIEGTISAEDFSVDGINPTDAGARIYGEAVTTFIDALLASRQTPDKPERHTLPEPLFAVTNDSGRVVAYEDPAVRRSGPWLVGQASPIGPFRHLLVSNTATAALTMKFKGTEIGLLDVAGPDSARIEYAIDGAASRTLEAPVGVTAPQMRAVELAAGLDRVAEHELVLMLASPGTVRIGGLLVNGTVADGFSGMTPLERIDAVYKDMDPVVYDPPPGRFEHLPRTMSKLSDRGELRMVLLGDSIMGNTSGSQFDLLMMRSHPNCKVVKIPSLRSSTGCTYYREEGRVREYVLKHAPDLVLIGGISNRGDAEAVRSVIRQVRAEKPDTEFLLLTPVFGRAEDEHIKTYSREIDPTTANFRSAMQKVAAEERCGFFDMTGPWWAYIQNSGKTYGWFLGDAVHANERGCQIIGRLLDRWFQD